ncbi:type IV toxin-antitoxin system AbiEi family antitoxin [Lentzea sp. NBC_00516]|uniref:type IV toxin-antitoxin system AbiEi family antitoxin n=1 Tax=Lentzea sp. NBC_00516 TaxID=2903582 RepID=UPI002E823079|nr:type IV toxin-antitoxin system AbiEi family antitoxin [Lentzea sp. NBC_00516]WUD22023.1 type IV toxin-antitoxin system AbiEi family antitoxin [Lentzea sp. NBC_00516]
MSRNGVEHGTTEAELILSALLAIRSVLPSTWMIEPGAPAIQVDSRRVYTPDGQFVITAPDGTKATVLLECKAVVVPRDVAGMVRQLKQYASAAEERGVKIGGLMLVSPFVSPTTRAQAEQHHLMGWFDLTGNLRLRVDQPALFVDRTGADRSGSRDPADRLLKSLRGPAAAKVVLELCETSVPVGVRDLAGRAGVGAATSARVLELLDREAVITRGDDGAVIAVRKRALVDRWVQDYKVMASNEVITTLDPRGLSHALATLRVEDSRVALTGSAAARAYLPHDLTAVSPLVSLSLYAEDPIGLMDRLGLRSVERGMNVLVMKPYDDVVYARSRRVEGLDYVAPAQVVADLLTGPGRSTEEAEQLMTVLETSEAGWKE